MNVAFIPVRGGCKSISLKNIRLMAGKPLVYWTTKAACDCSRFDKVYACTDSQVIHQDVLGFVAYEPVFSKLDVVGRSAELAPDTAPTESVLLEFVGRYDFSPVALVQAFPAACS